MTLVLGMYYYEKVHFLAQTVHSMQIKSPAAMQLKLRTSGHRKQTSVRLLIFKEKTCHIGINDCFLQKHTLQSVFLAIF